MKVQTIVYTTDMTRALDWYRAFLETDPEYASGVWSVFGVGDARLALHRVDELPVASRMELSMISEGSLEGLVDRVGSAGISPVQGIQDETFGRSILFRDPEGLPIQVNEYVSTPDE